MPSSIQDILKKHWGYSQFRELQEEIIQSALNGNDTLALMPTGGGKSLCFQIPALANDGLCIVVTPLIALMKDQVAHLKSKNIKAVAIYSGMSMREIDVTLDNCIYGNHKFLYCSPERLATELFRVRAEKMNVNLLAVDEAHCISQWGYDFRPPYLKIAEFREIIPGIPVLALTATATPDVVKDICEKLHFSNPKIFRKSFQRSNLSYSVLFEENKQQRMVKMLNKIPGTAIIYARNRRKTRELSLYLNRQKISSDYYHAGLTHEERERKQDDWMKNKSRVMVCTNAFGMGIDKPDVRLVIHADVPEIPEAYFQEVGRGGRDEKKSFAVLLYNHADLADLKQRLAEGFPTVKELQSLYQALGNFFQLAVGSGEGVAFDFDLQQLCKAYQFTHAAALTSLRILEQEGYISMSESVFLPSRAMFIVDRETLYRFEVEQKKYETIIRALLRAYGGIFESFVDISEKELAGFLSVDVEELITQLTALQQFNLLNYQPRKDAPQMTFILPRVESERIEFNIPLLKKRKEAHDKRVRTMIAYLNNHTVCRSKQLLHYFGEEQKQRCGICEVCLKRNQLNITDLELDKITNEVKAILHHHPHTIQQLTELAKDYPEKKTLFTLRWLLDNHELKLNEKNQLILPS